MGIKPAKGAKAAPTTVTQKHLAADIAAAHDLSKKQGEAIMNDIIALLVKNLKKGCRIRMAGLGVLQVRKRAARMGRNPATGEAIKIKASKKVAFRAAKELKEADLTWIELPGPAGTNPDLAQSDRVRGTTDKACVSQGQAAGPPARRLSAG